MEERLKAANLEMFKVRASSAALGKWGQRAGGGLLLQGGRFLKGLGTGGEFPSNMVTSGHGGSLPVLQTPN